ncbi:anti-anti-sigma factor [Nonomuraea thailandensis]|uniref:Anti-sigma factor antagonist n=1 Tax=Nonomuraea thailandensis TaxID=1188745 RepID=A0A9X2GXL0_9ACTN|nr:STAS domain-containing protein [Nonomuraea thailandensis]MCP2365840.1 anti-anti-sigma factor [Nonomuraea thailandensis]
MSRWWVTSTGPEKPSRSAGHFTVTIGLHEAVIVARAVGELDYASTDLLHRQITHAWAATRSAGLVLDLSGLTFCDSMGVGVLVLLLRQSRRQQAALILSGIPPRLERLLTVTGLRTAFHVEASVEEAIQAIRAAPRPPAAPPPGESEPG